jgi:hypothetical protein
MSPLSAHEPGAVIRDVPQATLDWLTEPNNPAVAVLTRRTLLDEPDSPDLEVLWASRNEYAPVAAILDAMQPDGSWDRPARDYQKYGGSLWQIVILGELYASGSCHRIQCAAEYAFSRQLDDGSWSATNKRPAGAVPCLTANVARGLARMGWSRDERVIAALTNVAGIVRDHGFLACPPGGSATTLNGYCHMLAPKLLLLLGEVPRDLWPDGAVELRDECVRVLRDKQVFRCLPKGSREFAELAYRAKTDQERAIVRARFIAEHGPLEWGDKPGWRRFGYPLSYNSDVLEALLALAGVGEDRRPEYEAAIDLVRATADPQMRWTLKNTLNGKMIADVEVKGQPSKWLTLRALAVLRGFEAETAATPAPRATSAARVLRSTPAPSR